MKNIISKCVVEYESWQMQCCGTPLKVGQVANLHCIKNGSHINALGIKIDYDEEHHGQGTNCILRGIVSRIQTVFIDKFANEKQRRVDDKNNVFAVLDTSYVDGRENCDNYGNREGSDASSYIITLENVMERSYKSFDGCFSHGKYIHIEPSEDSDGLFWDEGSRLVGMVDSLSYYEGEAKKTIDLVQESWYPSLLSWVRNFQSHIHSGYEIWGANEWLDWWCTGYSLAKKIMRILPSDVQLFYGQGGQSRQVITHNGKGWELNMEQYGCLLTPNVELLEYEGVLIPKAKLIGVDDEVKRGCYTFLVSSNVHHLFPNDRVMLCADGSDTYQIGTIEKVNKDSMVICMDRPLPQGELFSTELIG